MGKLIIIERAAFKNIDTNIQGESGYVKIFEINSKYKSNINEGIRMPLDKNGNGAIIRGFLMPTYLQIVQSDTNNITAFYIFSACYFSI